MPAGPGSPPIRGSRTAPVRAEFAIWRRGAGLRLTLLARAGCHLCDEMQDALRPVAARHGASVSVIDLDDPAHAALEGTWGGAIPVLLAGDPHSGVEICRHRLDPERLAAALELPNNIASRAEIR